MQQKNLNNRRDFIKTTSTLIAGGLLFPHINFGKALDPKAAIVGHGDFRYKVKKEWGTQDPSIYPVKDCHEMVQDKKGRLILLTNETQNNVMFYDRSGKVLDTWGHDFPGAHGLTLHDENGEEFLYITDHDRHQVFKTTLDGKILLTLDYPKETGVYDGPEKYKPTEVAISPNGDIYIADGYGQSYVIQYSSTGEYIRHFGGNGDADDQLKQAHGICLDTRKGGTPELIVTSRIAHEFKRFSLDGKQLETIAVGNCWINRPVIKGDNLYFSVLRTETAEGDDGISLVLDKNDKVISAPGGSAPTYVDGKLQTITFDGKTFMNPHDVCIDNDENIYVPQWNSGKTYPVLLERV
ncbi:6-bladed beta-propeller [Echinicola strongylocentroti]|uniref:6-bladed beta-propeller n=1 Tax=Echinicola strongylocentroti TaxID=1795355 RepID=A0A2Z4IHN9_9BACT|nr:6-bladed beta-propeller [Echinicola strongylocentroti]AWW30217.1 6-bladed beta-propeller [Echinicola strongylocentroti]